MVRWSTWESVSNIEAIELVSSELANITQRLSKIVNKTVVVMPSAVGEMNGDTDDILSEPLYAQRPDGDGEEV